MGAASSRASRDNRLTSEHFVRRHSGTLAQATFGGAISSANGCLTHALRSWQAPSVTVEYVVTYAPIPFSFALFTCNCGATSVECDMRRAAPDNWTVADDGSHLCAHCAAIAKQML